MDILGEYERQRPVSAAPVRPTAFSSESQNGFFIRLVMRLSGGKIENARQASMVLLAAAVAILLVSIFIFARASGWFSSGSGNLNIPAAGPQDSRFQNQQP